MINFSNLASIGKIWLRTLIRGKSSIKSPFAVTAGCGPNLEDRALCAVDPCDVEKCYQEPRVVIIGAGMAGLSAAARLSQRGINNITVLEAYERPGGRIHSCWLGDIVAELGSHWKPDNTFTHPVYTMSATEDPPRPGVPGSEHTRGLFNRIVTGKMAFPPTLAAYHKFRQIEQEAAQIYCLGGSKQAGSLINFMSLRIQQELHEYPEEQQHDAARIMFGLCHMLSARCGDDTAMLCADHVGCFMNMPGGEVRVPLGLIGILAPLLRQIPEGAIRYCKPVNCIYWGTSQKQGYRAVVCACDGEEFPCDYVIITVSLGVLYNNAVKMFCPSLPASKIDAMRCLGFGFCNKIYMEYCRPFWYWHKGNLNFKFCCNELCDRSDWTRGITSIEAVPNSKHVICAWVVGQEAVQMEGLCDKDIAEGLTEILRLSTGNPSIPYPITILRSHWTSDPFFCGAYSYDCYGSDGQSQRSLACPLPGPSEPIPPILLFAGEATVPGHYATVSGARLSGVREAERVLQLTLQFKGPPLPCVDHQPGAQKKVKTAAKYAQDRPPPPPRPPGAPPVRAAPRGPCSARHISQNTSIIAWCVSPLRARTRVGSSARGSGVRWRGVCAGAGGAWRARGAGGARAAARAAVARRQAAARVALRSLAARCIAALAISRQGATVADVGVGETLSSVSQCLVSVSHI